MQERNDSCAETSNKSYQPIQEFFSGKTVGITGGTGFVGQALIEKLLRTCPDVKKIILLIRKKTGISPDDRIKQLTSLQAFDLLRKTQPNFAEKLQCISCDLEDEQLGLSPASAALLRRNCDLFIHLAATLRFTEHLRIAFELNVQCVRRLLALFKTGKNNLQAFIHVSTAYSHCERDIIDEQLYDTGIDYLDLESSLRWMTDDLISRVTSDILGKRPNTYTLTKALAEDVIARESGNLPACIVRPSMIVPALKEPMPGWSTNVYGPSAFMISYGKGIMRAVVADKDVQADIIPVDFVVNAILAAATKTACDHTAKRSLADETDSGRWSSEDDSAETGALHRDSISIGNAEDAEIQRGEIPIYHVNSSTHNLLLIGDFERLMKFWYERYPCSAFRRPGMRFTKSRTLFDVMAFSLQTIPAYVVDTLLGILQNERKFVRLNKRMLAAMDVMEYFYTHGSKWRCSKADQLRNQLSEKDRKTFYTDPCIFTWDEYFEIYVRGCNKYILKEDESQYEKSKKTLQRLCFADRCLSSATLLGLLGIVTSGTGLTSAFWEAGSKALSSNGLLPIVQ